MTVQRDTIIAEILQNDPEQGCVPIFLSTGMHCLGCLAAHGEDRPPRPAPSTAWMWDALIAQLNDYFAKKQ